MLVAFAASDGPSAANAQTLTISGAGLTWTRVRSTAGRPGVVEIWTATAPALLTNVTVTSTQSVTAGGPYNQSLTVVAFSGVSGVGATNARAVCPPTRAPAWSRRRRDRSSTRVGNDFDRAVARTSRRGQTKVHEFFAPTGDTFWVQAGERADRGGRHDGDAERHRAGAGGSIQLRDRRVEAAVGGLPRIHAMDMDRTRCR